MQCAKIGKFAVHVTLFNVFQLSRLKASLLDYALTFLRSRVPKSRRAKKTHLFHLFSTYKIQHVI